LRVVGFEGFGKSEIEERESKGEEEVKK